MITTPLFLEKSQVLVGISNIRLTDDGMHLVFDYEVKEDKQYDKEEEVEQELSRTLLNIIKRAAKNPK